MKALLLAAAAASAAAQAGPVSIETLFVMDCGGVARLLPDTPLETNIDLRFFRKAVDRAAAEMRMIAAKNNATCRGQLTDEIITRNFLPSVDAMLNYIDVNRRRLPEGCPWSAFPQTWFDSSLIENYVFGRSMYDFFGIAGIGPRQNWSIPMPATCNYDSWVRGAGCRLKYTEPTTGTLIQLAIDRCPNSIVPYVSVSAAGDFVNKFGRPCTSIGSAQGCGAGLVCSRIGAPWANLDMTMPDIFNAIFNAAGITSTANDLDACRTTTLNGVGEISRKVRDKVFSLFGMPAPTDMSSGDFGFCMPSVTAWDGWSSAFSKPGRHGVAVRRTPINDPATMACTATGCNITRIGNDICDVACNNTACKFDGGDCLKRRDSMAPMSCFADARDNTTNTVEMCNGYNNLPYNVQLRSYYNGFGGTQYANYYTQYAYCSTSGFVGCQCTCVLKPGYIAAGTACENCMPPTFCPGTYNATTGARVDGAPCVDMATTITGLGNLISAWDGMLMNGALAHGPDRKSGAAFTKVSSRFDVSGALGSNFAPLLQTTCAGDLAISLGNPNMAMAISMPRAPELVSFISQLLQEVVTCRLKTIDSSSVLTQAQFYVRYGLHQLASWAYQLTSFGTSSADVPALISLGSRALSDFLVIGREPVTAGTDTKWTTGWRMNPPSSECTLATLLEPGNRRCRFQYTNFANLFTYNGITPKLNIHIDVQEDVCTGAPMAGGKTMSATDAAHTWPVVGVFVESDFVRAMNALKPCSVDADCSGLAGTSCFDLDVGISDLASDGNPLARFVYGENLAGRPGAEPAELLGAIRRFLMSMGSGAAAVNSGMETSKQLKFCVPRVQAVIDNFQSWGSSAYNQGSCDGISTRCISQPARVTGMAEPTITGLYSGAANGATVPAAPAQPPATAVSFKVKIPGLTRTSFTNAVRSRLQQIISEQLAMRGIIVPPSAIVFTAIAEVVSSGRLLQAASGAVAVTFSIDVTQTTIAPPPAGAPAPTSGSVSSTAAVTDALTTQLTSTTSPVTVAASIGNLLAAEGIIPAASANAAVAVSSTTTLPGEQATYTANGASGSGSSGGLSGGAAAGVAIGVIALIAIVAVAAFLMLRGSRTKPLQSSSKAVTSHPDGAPPANFQPAAGGSVITVPGGSGNVVIITQPSAPQPSNNPDFAVMNPVSTHQKASFAPHVTM